MPIISASLEANLPSGWFLKESLTLLAPDGQSNVILSVEPLDPTITADEYARRQGSLLASQFSGYQEASFEPCIVFGRLPGFIREFSWRPPDGVPVSQLQVYGADAAKGYTGTATVPSTLFAERAQLLRELLLGAWIK